MRHPRIKKTKLSLNFGLNQSYQEDHIFTYDTSHDLDHFIEEHIKFHSQRRDRNHTNESITRTKKTCDKEVTTQAMTVITPVKVSLM